MMVMVGRSLHKCTLVEVAPRAVLYKSSLVNKSRAQAALALKALGEPRRLEILELLRKGPRSVGEIADQVDVSQQAVSQHLAVLDRAGLVEARREGTRSVYAVRPSGFAPVGAFVRDFWEPRLSELKADIEGKK
jgi:DNA-binding transcriptional ArsR family regulator